MMKKKHLYERSLDELLEPSSDEEMENLIHDNLSPDVILSGNANSTNVCIESITRGFHNISDQSSVHVFNDGECKQCCQPMLKCYNIKYGNFLVDATKEFFRCHFSDRNVVNKSKDNFISMYRTGFLKFIIITII